MRVTACSRAALAKGGERETRRTVLRYGQAASAKPSRSERRQAVAEAGFAGREPLPARARGNTIGSMRGSARLRRLLGRPAGVEPVRIDSPEAEAAAFAAAGEVLSPPTADAKGIFLVNGTRLRFFEPLAGKIRADYVTTLVHFWAIHESRIREYRHAAELFDAVEIGRASCRERV